MELKAYYENNRETYRSQRDLADELGISVSFLSQIMNSRRRPDPVLAQKISRVTGGVVPWTSFFPDPDQAPDPVEPHQAV